MSKKTNESSAEQANANNIATKKRKRSNSKKNKNVEPQVANETPVEILVEASVETPVLETVETATATIAEPQETLVKAVISDNKIADTDEKPVFDFNSLPDEFFNRYYIYHGHGVNINNAHRIATPESIARLLADPGFVNEYLNDPDMSLQGETPPIDIEAIAFDQNKTLLKEGMKTLPLRRTYAAKYGRDGKLYMVCVEFNLETEPSSFKVKYIDPKSGAERESSIPNSPTKQKGISLAIEKLERMLAGHLAGEDNLFSTQFAATGDDKTAAVELPYTKLLIDIAYLNEDGTVDELPGEHFLKCANIIEIARAAYEIRNRDYVVKIKGELLAELRGFESDLISKRSAEEGEFKSQIKMLSNKWEVTSKGATRKLHYKINSLEKDLASEIYDNVEACTELLDRNAALGTSNESLTIALEKERSINVALEARMTAYNNLPWWKRMFAKI